MSGWINYDAPSWWDHSYALNWLAIAPLKHWRAVTLGGTPQRVIGLDFSDTRESVKVFNARTRQWEASQPFTREWTLRGVIPTQLGRLTALETLDLGGSELTGSVPTQLGSLTALTRLDLGDNKLTGAIPTQLGSLTALTNLALSVGNAFTGCIPGPLWAATTHDLVDLMLTTCTDAAVGHAEGATIEYDEAFGPGTYKIPLDDWDYVVGDNKALVFTVPAGLRIELDVVSRGASACWGDSCDEPPAALFSGGDGSDVGFGICIDIQAAEECWRSYPYSIILGEPVNDVGRPVRISDAEYAADQAARAAKYGPLLDQLVASAHIEAVP